MEINSNGISQVIKYARRIHKIRPIRLHRHIFQKIAEEKFTLEVKVVLQQQAAQECTNIPFNCRDVQRAVKLEASRIIAIARA
jgi:hypothetical protein